MPVLETLSQQCCHPMRDIRQHAFTLLQKALLLPDFGHNVDLFLAQSNAFNLILFPLLEEFLKSQTVIDANGLDESRMRACAMLCRQFLQYLAGVCTASPHLDSQYWSSHPEEERVMSDLWSRVLEYLERYMETSNSNDFLVTFSVLSIILFIESALNRKRSFQSRSRICYLC